MLSRTATCCWQKNPHLFKAVRTSFPKLLKFYYLTAVCFLAYIFYCLHETAFMKKENKFADQELSNTTIGDLLNSDTLQVNGHYVPDEDDDDDDDEEDKEDDLVLGDEDELEGDEAEYEVDLEDDAEPDDVDDDDLVLDTDDEEEEEDEV